MSGRQARVTGADDDHAGGEGRQDETAELLGVLVQQGAQTLELVRAILNLLLPKEGSREGPTLEQLLAAILDQQRAALLIAQTTQAELARLGESLPDAVAEAVSERSVQARTRPS